MRVPTHPEGSSLYWEFATDSYDLGFGVFFEWTLEPGDQITVQTSDSEDEGEEEGEEEPPEAGGEQAAASTGAAQPPKGSSCSFHTTDYSDNRTYALSDSTPTTLRYSSRLAVFSIPPIQTHLNISCWFSSDGAQCEAAQRSAFLRGHLLGDVHRTITFSGLLFPLRDCMPTIAHSIS